MSKGRLGQLLEEFLADLLKKDRDLVFIVLLLEVGIVKEEELSCPGNSREMAIEIPRLFSPTSPLALLVYFPAKYSTEA
jgi:hypothetical protein